VWRKNLLIYRIAARRAALQENIPPITDPLHKKKKELSGFIEHANA